MSESPHVIVVGSGALGASTAWHLTQHGARVTLLERGPFAAASSGRAAGLGLQIPPDDVLMAVSRAARDKLLSFERDTGQPLVVHESGSIKVARTAADAELLRDEYARGRRAGVEVELIDAATARELCPWFDPIGAVAMWYAPGDVYLEPADLPRAYLAAIHQAGGKAFDHTPVLDLVRDADARITGVRTPDGTLTADHVVLAAGAWNQVLADAAGAPLPLWPVRHELCVTEPHPSISDAQPAVRVIDAKTYIRPYQGGLMFGGYEADPTPVDLVGRAPDLTLDDLPTDDRPLRGLAELVRDEFPLLHDLRWDVIRGGLPTLTPDGHYLLGPLGTSPGLWTIGGCNVAGLSTSPALGADLASWIATGRRPDRVASFGVERFNGRFPGRDALRESCLATYTDKYSSLETEAG